jgi:hypothetical protein
MFGRTRTFVMISAWAPAIAACAPAMPTLVQDPAPTTTAFDGTYAGVSREGSAYMKDVPNRYCGGGRGVPVPLTITNGVINYTSGSGWEGIVNPQGGLVMRNSRSSRIDGQIDSQGIIRAQVSGTGCVVKLIWQKQSQ